MTRLGAIVALAATAVLPLSPAWALLPDVQSITPTDVTARSFSVVWLATAGSTPSLRVFEAPACEVQLAGIEVEAYPTLGGAADLAEAASDRGVMKVRVSGLAPDTDYCFQTATTSAGGETRFSPLEPQIVRTASLTRRADGSGALLTPFSNDLVRFAVDLSTAPTAGLLLLARVEGARTPISSFIGDGIDDDGDPSTSTALVLLDLNNLYTEASAVSLDLTGDGSEGMVFLELGGPLGSVPVHARLVPPDTGLSGIVDPLDCAEAATGADCDGLLGDALGDATPGAEDPDAIMDVIVGNAATVQCPVCADVDFDSELTLRDALALAQFVGGLGTLP